jgi:prophage regulatory protein
LRLPEVEQRTGRKRSAIYADPDFPAPVPIGPRAVGWLESEIDVWLRNCIRAIRPSRGRCLCRSRAVRQRAKSSSDSCAAQLNVEATMSENHESVRGPLNIREVVRKYMAPSWKVFAIPYREKGTNPKRLAEPELHGRRLRHRTAEHWRRFGLPRGVCTR